LGNDLAHIEHALNAAIAGATVSAVAAIPLLTTILTRLKSEEE